jgi:predicted AAA+ superfamily ATPase
MLQELSAIHNEVMATTNTEPKRYLFKHINWDAKALCIHGDRGVGKTTLLCQHLLEKYKTANQALYLSADNINVTSSGIFNIARDYFNYGGKALFIDEAHKYPNWSIEIKNILDTYRNHKVIFSGSSSIDLQQSKGDLSRRVIYYKLTGLSFREYLKFSENIDSPILTLADVIKNHIEIADQFKSIQILKKFKEYLEHGYYPFFLEGEKDYLLKVNNIIEKVIFEDIAVIYNLKQTTLPILKRLLWLIATTDSFTPNVDSISKNLKVSRDIIYNCLDYLNRSGLTYGIYADAQGMKLARKPGKIYANNTNLLSAINGDLKLASKVGGIRETFFVNQVTIKHKVNLHDSGDFIIDDKFIIEVGGPGKNEHQIKSIKNAYLAIDDITIGFDKKIPLYLFGMLY